MCGVVTTPTNCERTKFLNISIGEYITTTEQRHTSHSGISLLFMTIFRLFSFLLRSPVVHDWLAVFPPLTSRRQHSLLSSGCRLLHGFPPAPLGCFLAHPLCPSRHAITLWCVVEGLGYRGLGRERSYCPGDSHGGEKGGEVFTDRVGCLCVF